MFARHRNAATADTAAPSQPPPTPAEVVSGIADCVRRSSRHEFDEAKLAQLRGQLDLAMDAARALQAQPIAGAEEDHKKRVAAALGEAAAIERRIRGVRAELAPQRREHGDAVEAELAPLRRDTARRIAAALADLARHAGMLDAIDSRVVSAGGSPRRAPPHHTLALADWAASAGAE